MLRVHFTATDVLRTRFAPAPAPLLELSLAVITLQRREVIFDGWRRAVRTHLPKAAHPLVQLLTPGGVGPLFLDPMSDGFEDGLELVRSSPTELVRRELRRVCGAGMPITPWLRALDERDGEAWQLLERAVRAGHAALVAPAWARLHRAFQAEVSWRGRLIAELGLQPALETLHPGARWRGTTLEFDVPRRHLSIDAAGRGVTLMPSAFWAGQPLLSRDADGAVMIVYSAPTALPLVADEPADGALADLLGRTRAGVLALAVSARTTSDIARTLGISAASVSEHTRTLRAAGLLVSERAGKAVLHSATPLGDRLLAGGAGLPLPQASPPTVPMPAAVTSRSR